MNPKRKTRGKARGRPRGVQPHAVNAISATEAARRFSDLLSRIEYRGERVVIERGGKAVCEMVPARARSFRLSELVAFLAEAPIPDEGFWTELEAVQRSQPALQPSPWQS